MSNQQYVLVVINTNVGHQVTRVKYTHRDSCENAWAAARYHYSINHLCMVFNDYSGELRRIGFGKSLTNAEQE